MLHLSGKMDECLEYIKEEYESNRNTIKRLQEKIKELKEENYKDKLVAQYKKERDVAIEDSYRGFPISEEQQTAINEWVSKHEKEKHPLPKGAFTRGGAIGGNYSYHFTPTSIGTFGSIKCTCGEQFSFQEA